MNYDPDMIFLPLDQQSVCRVVGLMSGTSVDGVDAACVEVHGNGPSTQVRVLAHATYPYAPDLREQILAASYPESGQVDLICHVNVAVGECFAEATLAIIEAAGLKPDEVDLIGSHGQTLYHIPTAITHPPRSARLASTLQVGEPCVIAERTGITTVADFRPRDMAAGGVGAPLAPYAHHLLFADPDHPKLVQNIGGIGNVSVLAQSDLTQTLAFDTGPGNMLMDAAVTHFTAGQQFYDAGGEFASQGTVHPDLLATLMQHPFVHQAPPKATGREAFGHHLWQEIQAQAQALNLSVTDVVRTCTAFTVDSMVFNYEQFVYPQYNIDEIIVCGGGAENPVLMQMLRDRVSPIPVHTPEDYGYPNEALEAILSAMLAHATIHGQPANIPRTTGATHAVILGKIIPGIRR